jgi:hypothetical protein
MPSRFSTRRPGRGGLCAALLLLLLTVVQAQGPVIATNDFACGDVMATWSPDELAEVLRNSATPAGTDFGFFVALQIVPALQYGLEVRKLCASCVDVAAYDDADVCPATAYGYDTTHSGLLLIPTEEADGAWKAGTSLLHVHMHGADRTTLSVPSQNVPDLFLNTTSAGDTFMGLVLSATAGVVTIVPDFLGTGEAASGSSDGLLPSSFVRQGYITSTWPLIAAAQQLVAEESNCTSLVANDVMVTGYSEGGYAATSLLPALDALGYNVVQAFVGAVAARLSSVQIMGTFEGFSPGGGIDPSLRFILAWLATAYSSTSTDVTSFGAGQDILRAEDRDRVLDTLATTTEIEGLNNLTAPDDPLAYFSDTILAFLQAAVDNNVTEPCNSDLVVVGETDQFCAALQANDLVDVLESSTVPITLLHSAADELVRFENLPDLSANPLLSYVPLSGGHLAAGAEYLFVLITTIQAQVGLGSFLTFEANATVVCPLVDIDTVTDSPTSAPSAAVGNSRLVGSTAVLLLGALLLWLV